MRGKNIYFFIFCCFIFLQKTAQCSQNIVNKPLPKRIISLAPSITEILFSLNLDNKIVGVTDFCNFPKSAQNKTKIGGFINTNIEVIISLKPDLVIATKDGNDKITVDKIRSLNIPLEVVQTLSVNDIYNSILQISAWTGQEKNGKSLVDNLKNNVLKIKDKGKNLNHPKVLLVFGHNPLIVAGPGTFSNELIEIAGGENIANNAVTRYPQYSLEEIIKKDPDLIIEATMFNFNKDAELNINNEWQKFPNLKAVKMKKIFFIDSDLITRPGPRIIEALEKMELIFNNNLR